MSLLLRCLILFIAGLAVGPLLAHQQGYVLIVMAGYKIEMSLLSFLLLLVLALAGLIGCGRFLIKIAYLKRWLQQHQQIKAEQRTREALFKLLEGDYQQAEQMFNRSAHYSPFPLLNHLLAAEATQRRADWSQSHQHLTQAAALVTGQVPLALEIMQIRLQLATRQSAAVHQQITTLLLAFPQHPELLRLAKKGSDFE